MISNFIEFDDNGKVTKFDDSKMIHTLNKTMNGHLPDEFIEKVKNRKYKILIGDLIEDVKMIDEKEEGTTLRIGILTKEMENEENLELYKERFDVVLTEEEDLSIWGRFLLDKNVHLGTYQKEQKMLKKGHTCVPGFESIKFQLSLSNIFQA